MIGTKDSRRSLRIFLAAKNFSFFTGYHFLVSVPRVKRGKINKEKHALESFLSF